jgi:sialic acid synthase SpsE
VSQHLKIDDRIASLEKPCLIVAEIAQMYDNNLGMAHSFIDAIANAEALLDTNVATIRFSKMQRSNPSAKST